MLQPSDVMSAFAVEQNCVTHATKEHLNLTAFDRIQTGPV
jgi:hypothetical protein